MGKSDSGGSSASAIDPRLVIPVQSQANKDAFNYATNTSRINQYGPTGSTTWTKSPSLDYTAYSDALQKWQQQNGVPVTAPDNPYPWTPVNTGGAPNMRPLDAGDGGDGTGGGSGSDSGGTGAPGTGSGSGIGGPPGNDGPGGNAPGDVGGGTGGPNGTTTGTDGTTGTNNNAAALLSGAQPLPSSYTQDQWSQTTSLTPEQQAIFNANQGAQTSQAQLLQALSGQLGGIIKFPLDFSSAPGLTGSVSGGAMPTFNGGPKSTLNPTSKVSDRSGGLSSQMADYQSRLNGLDPTQFNQGAADASYAHATTYLDPQMAEQKQALEARLAEQGFTPGTPGYDRAMQDYNSSSAQQYSDARNQSVLQGANIGHTQYGDSLSGINSGIASALQNAQYGLSNDTARSSEGLNLAQFGLGQNNQNFNQGQATATTKAALQNQGFNQNLQAGQFGNSARSQAIAEILQQRQQPLNELNALKSGSQISTPTGTGQAAVPGMSATDTTGAYGNYANALQGQQNAATSSSNANTAALAQLAGAAALYFSDSRLKDNIRQIGLTPGGHRVFAYTIFGRPEIGVMAQEVRKIHPELVHEHESGFLMVDYSGVR